MPIQRLQTVRHTHPDPFRSSGNSAAQEQGDWKQQQEQQDQSQQLAWRTEHYTTPGQQLAHKTTCEQFQRQGQQNGAQEQEQREQGQAEQQQRKHEQVQQLEELEQEQKQQRSEQAEMLPQQKKQQKQQKQRNSCECKAPGK
ncbi:hypothetical protein ETH_00006565 [Eimeria tenella]|uniref:Uncharacterized protein n=1 Tax=Eimeria tenella TaxID=5802 RepID=U6KWZ1_EIMTE|nr:hypothetical protein ETH_00006565 [Eimeria tenella]CDJ42667.1 hypothetical protein ETH_00006565 [Eimeria tenella]|eukprot:XP_013233417.1 hypothetical protein ETH_00006565 [Eimeria tenella]